MVSAKTVSKNNKSKEVQPILLPFNCVGGGGWGWTFHEEISKIIAIHQYMYIKSAFYIQNKTLFIGTVISSNGWQASAKHIKSFQDAENDHPTTSLAIVLYLDDLVNTY